MKAIGLLLAFAITLRASPSYSVNDLGTLGSSSAIGFKINDSGTVVGWAETIYGYPQAFQSANGGSLQALASLSASDSFAMGINIAGMIAGTAYVDGQPHGVLWNGNATTDLGAGVYATGINDPGVVVAAMDMRSSWPMASIRIWAFSRAATGVPRTASTTQARLSATAV